MPKQPLCDICREPYKKFNTLQKVCSVGCAVEHARCKDYLDAINDVQYKKTVDSVTKQHELTQPVFNRWVRLVKDKDETCCISCRRPRGGFLESAGHFKSVGSSGNLRYHPDNVNGPQCEHCNVHLSGNVAEYRKHLVAKIGIERVEWLEANAGKVKKWTIAELKDLRAKLSKEIREVAE